MRLEIRLTEFENDKQRQLSLIQRKEEELKSLSQSFSQSEQQQKLMLKEEMTKLKQDMLEKERQMKSLMTEKETQAKKLLNEKEGQMKNLMQENESQNTKQKAQQSLIEQLQSEIGTVKA